MTMSVCLLFYHMQLSCSSHNFTILSHRPLQYCLSYISYNHTRVKICWFSSSAWQGSPVRWVPVDSRSGPSYMRLRPALTSPICGTAPLEITTYTNYYHFTFFAWDKVQTHSISYCSKENREFYRYFPNVRVFCWALNSKFNTPQICAIFMCTDHPNA